MKVTREKQEPSEILIRTLTSGSRFLFWGIVPAGAILLGILTLAIDRRSVMLVLFLDLVFGLFAVGLYDPKRFEWALRCVAGIVSIGLTWALIRAFSESGGHHIGWFFSAAHGLFLLAIPTGIYAVRGLPGIKHHSGSRQQYSSKPIHPD